MVPALVLRLSEIPSVWSFQGLCCDLLKWSIEVESARERVFVWMKVSKHFPGWLSLVFSE
jgi:hypothetical protein